MTVLCSHKIIKRKTGGGKDGGGGEWGGKESGEGRKDRKVSRKKKGGKEGKV